MIDTLNSILDTHPDLICRMDKELNFTYANEAAATFFLMSKDALIGTHLFLRSEEKQHEVIKSVLGNICPESPSVTSLQRIDRPAGPQYVLFTIIGLYSDENVLQGYQSVGRDVTSKTLLEHQVAAQTKALDAVHVELRSVLDTVPSLIWYKDDKNKILRLNQAAAASMGMTVEEVEGKNTYDLFGEAAKDYHDADLSVFNSGKAIRGLVEPFTPDSGEQLWVQSDKIPFTDGEDGPRILVVSTDITELKEQEATLKSINKNLDDFASLASHDLQAPLRKIGISAELMQLELGDALPAEATAYFDDIAAGVNHMRQLIKCFLKFMRASPEGVDLGPVNLNNVLRQVANNEQGHLDETGGSLILPDAEIYVRGDNALLAQVFTNLVSNAIKYRSERRLVEIEITAETEKQYWVISVRDNGLGIDPSFADQVFDLFGRAKPYSEIEGSGVGLALCRRIITLHGGTIELIETGNAGSCFQVKLFRARRPNDG
ncbi:PAS domain-containing sensor histidine kinase [Algimonas arctica]|nr:PAS domain-containing sensor histidine kinase [Algimonas arctica]